MKKFIKMVQSINLAGMLLEKGHTYELDTSVYKALDKHDYMLVNFAKKGDKAMDTNPKKEDKVKK